MKTTIHICDICKKNFPDIRIKYKAKRQWSSWYESGWERIELCQECLDKIINERKRMNDSIPIEWLKKWAEANSNGEWSVEYRTVFNGILKDWENNEWPQ